MTDFFHNISIVVGAVVSGLALLLSGGSGLYTQLPVQPASVVVASLPVQGADAAIVATSTARASFTAPVGTFASAPVSTSQPNVAGNLPALIASASNNYVTEDQLDSKIEQAANTLRSLIYLQVSVPNSALASGGILNSIAFSQRIDQLANISLTNATVHGVSGLTAADIPANITASNYLALTGGALAGNIAVTGTASTSNLIVSNSFSLGTLTGFLKATAGIVATSLINLASDVTGILPASNGGTGWANIKVGSILFGNGASAVATSSSLFWDNTNGQLGIGTTTPSQALSVQGNSYTSGTSFFGGGITATSTFTLSGLSTLLSGFLSLASSTVGNGTQTGGLTIFGGATTTGNAYFTGNININKFSSYMQDGLTVLYASTTVHSTFVGTRTIPALSTSAVGALPEIVLSNLMGLNNIGIGEGALTHMSNGAVNVAIGVNALGTAAHEAYSVAVGDNVLALSEAYENTGVGYQVLSINTSGIQNTGIGSVALYRTTTGSYNSGIGSHTLTYNATGSSNTAVGYDALFNTNADQNTGVGQGALFTNVSGIQNVAIGASALYANTANGNTAVGAVALVANTTGSSNVAVGLGALFSNIDGSSNTAVGYTALKLNTSGVQNVGVGPNALFNNTSGQGNIAVGYTALQANQTGSASIAIGVGALTLATGSSNTAVGYQALTANVTGANNVAIGRLALSNSTGSSNTAVGYIAGIGVTGLSATGLSVFGYQAGRNLTGAADYNSLFGQNAGYGITTGTKNILVGASNGTPSTGQITTGSQNISIGYDVAVASSTANGQLDIGNFIYGTGLTGAGSTVSSGKIGIGTTSPSTALTVAGDITPSIDNNNTVGNSTYRWSAIYAANGTIQTSDQRLKSNITNLNYGLPDLLKLRPISFTWTAQPGQGTQLGFIAQEVQPVFPETVNVGDDANHTLGLTYTEFIPVIVKSIQQIATIAGDFKSNLIAWLGNASNGIGDFFANRVIGNQLCAKKSDGTLVCVTGDQLASAISGAAQSSGGGSSGTPDTTPPVITITGDNPAHLHVGDTYSDLGATVTDNVDQNLGVHAFVGPTPLDQVFIDTSTSTTYRIDYVATDSAGNTATSTRTVTVAE